MLESILKYSEFTCGVILFLFAMIQIIYKNRQFINYNIAGLYFCLSYVILTFWAFKSGLIFHAPLLLHTDMTMPFAIAPFVYFYLRTVLGIKTRVDSGYILHFVPAAAVLCAIIIHNLFNDPLIEFYRFNPSAYPSYTMNPLIRGIDFISNIYMLIYFLLTIKNIYSLIKIRKHKPLKELWIIFYYMIFILLFNIMMLVASIIKNNYLNISAIYLLTLSGIWYFVFSFRYPEFTQKAIKEAKIIRYQNSMLNGVDTVAVLERLDDLMVEEKIFVDEEITLQKLSELLMITPHQFSRILNSKLKMNFRTLINSYRIEESMKLMCEFPDKTILEIALASGFNSKSSYNAVFLKATGLTPSDYRNSLMS